MYFLITQMRRRGVALPLDEIRSTNPLEGDVYVQTERSKPLNRQAEVATVRKKNSAGPEPLTRYSMPGCPVWPLARLF